MKRKILLLLFPLLSLTSYSQNREDVKLPFISKDIKGQMVNANGWKKNQYGKWVTAKNKIPYDIEQQYKILANYGVNSLGHNKQNFISYQLRDVKIKDSTYSLLIEKYRDGYYKYESIEEGWTNANSYNFYVFDKKDLEPLKEIKNDSIHTFELEILYNDTHPFVDLTKLNNTVIAKDLNSVILAPSPYSRKKLFITVRRFKTKNIVQFFISPYYRDFEENMYYESDFLTFNSFLKLQ